MNIDLTKCPDFWYETESGEKYIPNLEYPDAIPEECVYQCSEFSNQLITEVYDVKANEKVCTLTSTYSDELATALVRSEKYSVQEAIKITGKSCERCMNVLAHMYGLLWGYPENSQQYKQANTECVFCREE